jgi:hypothetical protein
MNQETSGEARHEQVDPASPEPTPPIATEPNSIAGPDPVAGSPGPTGTVGTAPVRQVGGMPRAATVVNIVLGIAFLVAVGGVAFAAGRMTAPVTAAAAGLGRDGTGTPGGNGALPDGGAGRPAGLAGQDGQRRGAFLGPETGVTLEGTVESSSPDTLTIRTASGQTIEVALDGSTTYHAQASASSSDVKTGGTVIVRLGLRQPDDGTTTGPTASDVTVVP